MKNLIITNILFAMMAFTSCNQPVQQGFTGADGEVRLITLDPGHFHAALIQKEMYAQVDPEVYIYAPDGPDVKLHLNRIKGFNTRSENPTQWNSNIYLGDDYLEQMLLQRKGNVVVLAGNNSKKTSYIKKSVEAGYNVLADKPMVIDQQSFEMLREAFDLAARNNVLLYDVMTERYEITSQLQREMALMPEVFGTLEPGTPDNPSVIKESVHHFFKYVAGSVLQRPVWYFDVNQQGEGIIDVTTHLVDLIQWVCFPDVVLDYTKDVDVYAARRWPTVVTPEQFMTVTGTHEIPDFLHKDIAADGDLNIYANGEMQYALRGVHARVSVIWDYAAPQGGGDTHYSLMRGTLSNLVIRQGEAEGYIPMLFIEPSTGEVSDSWLQQVAAGFSSVESLFPGVGLSQVETGYVLDIPQSYRIGHEAHFAQVAAKYLRFLAEGKLPVWEVPNMLTKYYTTTRALQLAHEK